MINEQRINSNAWLVLGCWLAGLTVVLGAFGAHGLQGALEDAVEDPAKNLKNWETGSRYMMYHSIGIIIAGLGISIFGRKKSFQIAGVLFLKGIILFSGLLYTLALTDIKILGAIVPIGGLSMIIGWIVLGMGFISSNAKPSSGTCDD